MQHRRAIRVGAVSGLVVLVIGGLFGLLWIHRDTQSSAATASIDPRLILVQHNSTIWGRLGSALPARMDLWPSLPGINRLQVAPPSNRRPQPREIEVAARMLGMAMVPTVGRLKLVRGRYGGKLNLPMFGRYGLTVWAPHDRWLHGSVTANVPLPPLGNEPRSFTLLGRSCLAHVRRPAQVHPDCRSAVARSI